MRRRVCGLGSFGWPFGAAGVRFDGLQNSLLVRCLCSHRTHSIDTPVGPVYCPSHIAGINGGLSGIDRDGFDLVYSQKIPRISSRMKRNSHVNPEMYCTTKCSSNLPQSPACRGIQADRRACRESTPCSAPSTLLKLRNKALYSQILS